MNKTTYQIPDGCTGVTIEQSEDKLIVVFVKEQPKEEKPWRAEHGERYWCYNIVSHRVFCDIESGETYDNALYDSGNYYRTEAEAQAALKHRLQFKFEG
jgi:hypothetical protein